jgi:DNA-directed RNA polymerase subunit L
MSEFLNSKFYKAFFVNLEMDIEIVSSDKNEVEVKLNNVTVAEVLRAYLNEQGIQFAAWRREHPEKPILLRIQSSGKTVKKAVSEAVAAVKKDGDKIISVLK